ncbi:MAG TPA: hypothetical protein VFF27_11245 [Bacteroidia bacterium]|jgi:hypothetical protein|nr:hypothetical protein [Bacteroidia bacterium]
MKFIKIKCTGFILFFLMRLVLVAQLSSPFNKLALTDQAADYSFIVSGHFHGGSSNQSTFPAATLLANIDSINALQPAFIISLGDLFTDVNEETVDHYNTSLFRKLKSPLFNAVGNHDVSNGNKYETLYGKSFYFFTYGKQLFLLLNTELNDGDIKGEQLELVKSALNKAKTGGIKQLFIFSHRPVWAEGNPRYTNIFKDNTQSKLGAPNFEKDILPLLQQVHLPIYWFSGSMGSGPASFFYDKNEKDGITYIQTAIRDTPRDGVLRVELNQNTVSFKCISLTGQRLGPLEQFGISYWTKNVAPEQSFNFRLLPYLTWLMIKHHYFWIGLITGVILLFLFKLLMKKWGRKK